MQHQEVCNWVLIRDFTLFQLKLMLDGLKGLVMAPLALIAVVVDLASKGPRRGRFFYRVLSLAERFDLWLNLYGAARRAPESGDGLFGASKAGSNTLLGRLEQMSRDLGFEDPLGRDQASTRRKYVA